MADMRRTDVDSNSVDISSTTDGLQGCLDKWNHSSAPSTVDAQAASR